MDEHSAQIKSLADAWKYITGGKAVFTLVSRATQRRYTYRVRKGNRGIFFADLMTGPDNESDYTYQGTVRLDGSYQQSKCDGCLPEDAPSIKALRWFLALAATKDERGHPGVEVWHEGKCSRCGRRLTDPESIATGLGPVCREKP
jgi:hypothetical protein